MTKQPSSEFKITDPAEMRVDELPPLSMSPGEFIKRVVLPEWGLSAKQAAELLGYNRVGLTNTLNGKHEVTRDLIYRLGALLGDHLADLLLAHKQAWDLEQEKAQREAHKLHIARLPFPSAD
jgi:plasmid maintenance system antidote protein VapI